MKASNGRNATRAQRLEHVRQRKGMERARQVCDELGWHWKPGVIAWRIRHTWTAWALMLWSSFAAAVAFLVDAMEISRWFSA